MDFPKFLENAKSLADIFEVVKSAVVKSMGRSRGGLMLGLSDLGNHPQGFFGAFFPVGTNIIVMNKIPLLRIKETQPELYKPYAFHVLLHEYLHTLGYLDESVVRKMVYDISVELFGKTHLTSRIAANTSRFFPNLVYPNITWQPEELSIELVDDFDRSSVNYIS
ncbi:MAG: hypothetical protein JSV49_11240 [Thermoplasmata archaeon]|nr:MAG: hypothetical protein JSV49_11240 [Thermoplasmata archaeon]